VMLNILFKAASQTLLSFGENALGGKLGFIATLPSWDQQLKAHFHLHLLVPGGALSKDGSSWRPLKGDYLFNQQALSLVFRGKFMEHMGRACQRENLKFASDQYKKLKARLYEKNWIIDVRDPVKKPDHVLEYLARYTHRVAISNTRLVSADADTVAFRWKDYRIKSGHRMKVMRLSTDEFIRRFLLHVLPDGFHRIRHYGLLAGANRKAKLATVRELLGAVSPAKADTTDTGEAPPLILREPCPDCGGPMRIIETFRRGERPTTRAPPRRAAA